MQDQKDAPQPLVLSYLALRKAIGLLGIALPFVLSLGALLVFRVTTPDSISGFYYTGMRDVFVGTLCAIGVFLMSYRGYERKDDIAGDLACVFAVGVALFPTTPSGDPTALQKAIGIAHFSFAALFFGTLAYFSLRLFTKTDETNPPTPRKILRNRVYRVCGYAILGAIALIAADALAPEDVERALGPYDPVYWLESLAVVAFGLSWLVKGEAILEDET